jgi:hypothetical protein
MVNISVEINIIQVRNVTLKTVKLGSEKTVEFSTYMIFVSVSDLSLKVEHIESISGSVESLHSLVHYRSQ